MSKAYSARVSTSQASVLSNSDSIKVDDVYGKLCVIGAAFTVRCSKKRLPHVVCECGCGAICAVKVRDLTRGSCVSCGCVRRAAIGKRTLVHGMTSHPIYVVWASMKSRCYYDRNASYSDYGARGIVVCEEWMHDSTAFIQWALSNGWESGLQIDRKDNNGPYAPWNCRFVTCSRNCRNKRNNRILTAFGESKTLTDWFSDPRCVCAYNCLVRRTAGGWDHELAISTPTRSYKFASPGPHHE